MSSEPIPVYHVIALPYPGRGHINPMMNLCKLLSSRCPFVKIFFVVTEEWLSLISSDLKPDNILFVSIPNVLPSEQIRSDDIPGFIEAVTTKMEEPFEELVSKLEVRASVILADVYVSWVVEVGKRRGVPVALMFPMPATVFSIFHHFDLVIENGQFLADLSVRGDELVDYIPGVSPIKLSDLPSILHENNKLLENLFKIISKVPKSQYLLFNSIFALESSVLEPLKTTLPFPHYTIGPLIPYFNKSDNYPEYLEWLDTHSRGSVLYVSLGSFLSTSGLQMDEIVSGLVESRVKFLLVARDKEISVEIGREIGMVVPWCEQLRVLCHSSIGGFWTHCGWNSTMEGAYAGVPMISFPLYMDQPTVSKIIADDWGIGLKLKGGELGRERLVGREEIADVAKRFMDPTNGERKEMIKRANQVRGICRAAIREGGSSQRDLDSFISNILK